MSVFSKCEHAITFFAQEMQIENIDFCFIQKILNNKKDVLNLSKFILGSTITLPEFDLSLARVPMG